MNQPYDPYNPAPAPAPLGSPHPPSISAPAHLPHRPGVVHVVAKPGGFWRSVSIVAGLGLFAIVFAVGLSLGIAIMIAGASMNDMVLRQTYRDGGPNSVAVIPIEGVIDSDQADFVRAAVDSILEDRKVRAVVLRVDSPGGGVTESDQIWYEINRLKSKRLPVVASYGGIAASGGYYISCHADHIMAQETTITGSIGVIAQVLTMQELMGKIGVQPVTLVATGSPEKDVANDIFRTWNDVDKTKIRNILDSAYVTFNKRVSDGRAKVITSAEHVNAVANGSIYTAAQALENGLIDEIGYLDDAIAVAESRGGIGAGRAKVEVLRKTPSFMDALMGANARGGMMSGGSLNADGLRNLVNDLGSPRLMYLLH